MQYSVWFLLWSEYEGVIAHSARREYQNPQSGRSGNTMPTENFSSRYAIPREIPYLVRTSHRPAFERWYGSRTPACQLLVPRGSQTLQIVVGLIILPHWCLPCLSTASILNWTILDNGGLFSWCQTNVCPLKKITRHQPNWPGHCPSQGRLSRCTLNISWQRQSWGRSKCLDFGLWGNLHVRRLSEGQQLNA